jgi:protocadherin Fat 4
MDLLHASAVDRDVGENGRLRFTILSGDSRGDFAIGETSGILRVNKQLDYERKNSYELTLQVSFSEQFYYYFSKPVSFVNLLC